MRKLYFIVMVLFAVTTNAQVINFADPLLKIKLLSPSALDSNGNAIDIDANNNNQIEVSEAAAVYTLYLQSANISNMSGIENFVNLRRLFCRDNNLTSLNVQSLVHLEELECEYNELTSLQVSGMASLKWLNFRENNLQSIDLSGLNNLEYLQVSSNPLQVLNLLALSKLETFSSAFNSFQSIDFSGLTNLKNISCNFNSNLTSLNASGCSSLIDLQCFYNALQLLSLSGCDALKQISCSSNDLTTITLNDLFSLENFTCSNNNLVHLDLSSQIKLKNLICNNNNLLTINLKNGISEENMNFLGNPNLRYICADDADSPNLLTYLTVNLLTGCEMNSYCSFVPGGNYFTVDGEHRFDIAANGCDTGDRIVPSMCFRLTDTATTVQGGYISNTSGNYSVPMRSGSYTLTPILENPTYFNVSPNAINVNFLPQSNSLNQNFCLSPNGNHSDLEIVALPIVPARPGFDVVYKIVYKNKGNQIQSGSAYFAFNDAVADFVSAAPAYSAQAMNYLVWHFSDLQPFESREILVTLNINSPIEIPAVNSGFMMYFTASINGGSAEGTPEDNVFGMNQIVVNSFDANEKVCLQGNVISPEMIGKDLHYMIRFGNTGTTIAQNVVVKDIIDTSKFDLDSLIPLSSSHPFVTKITSPNKVEFIFENINLPFDDTNNDGYVAFKIKTLEHLPVGTAISNSASIYFDNNFPVITAPAVSTLGVLSVRDFDFGNYFRIYPNPVESVLQIETVQSVTLTSISIYNALGQLVLTENNNQSLHAIDVSRLQSGNYLIKIKSDKGISTTKFIKK